MKKRTKLLLLCAGLVLVLAVGTALVLTVGTVVPSVTLEVGGRVLPQDYLRWDLGEPISWEADYRLPDLSVPGEHTARLRYLGLPFSRKLIVRDSVAPQGAVRDLTLCAAQRPAPEDFVVSVTDATEVTLSFKRQPDYSREGAQTVTLVLTDRGGNTTELPATLTLFFDTTPPQLVGATDRTVYIGAPYDLLAGVSASDTQDPAPVITVDDSALDPTKEGTYTLTYTATDFGNNRDVATVTATVVRDTAAPQLYGVRHLSAFTGGTVAYRSDVRMTDDFDPAPQLEVDSSAVDLTKPGVYPVTYTARDGAGNETVQKTELTVKEKPANYVDPEVIYARADEELAKIIKPDMTNAQKARAIWNWTRVNLVYEWGTDTTDWLQGAWQAMDQGKGDCFAYYAVCRLFFERLGFPHYTVQRDPSSVRSHTSHYWSLVSIDGGETFYHFDATIHPPPAIETFLVSDALLARFDRECPGYYTFDHSLYPPTPESSYSGN